MRAVTVVKSAQGKSEIARNQIVSRLAIERRRCEAVDPEVRLASLVPFFVARAAL
jgi:hypothetical protein